MHGESLILVIIIIENTDGARYNSLENILWNFMTKGLLKFLLERAKGILMIPFILARYLLFNDRIESLVILRRVAIFILFLVSSLKASAVT